MDIVSKLPFELKLIHRFPSYREEIAINFSDNDHSIWKEDFLTLSAEENDEIEIYFNSNDNDARLYLEALDIMPIDDSSIAEDNDGRIYRKVSDKSFVLYSSDSGYDALRVDSFLISILCENQWYYGVFEILPKPMNKEEWKMMRDDLEKEIHGMTQDIVRRNLGIGDIYCENKPIQEIYNFLVIKKYSSKMMMSLIDISNNPRYEIKTEYEDKLASNGYNYRFDSETMHRYAVKSGSEATLKVPIKTTCYDIQDNRILKKIMKEYERKLLQFIQLIEDAEKYSKTEFFGDSAQYRAVWNKSLKDFKETAIKLKKMTAILKAQEWYKEIGDIVEPYIPHSLILDSRYNTLYQMSMELKKNSMDIQLDSEFSYTWKRSSYLYEMWCYLRICHFFIEEYEMDSVEWDFSFVEKIFFPFLKKGTKLSVSGNNTRVEVVYDKCLPLNDKNSSCSNPLYIAKHHSDYRNHNRPDIVINVFDKESNIYIGSMVLECKYRKLYSFWSEGSSRSSRGQLEAYYNNARSTILFSGVGAQLDIHPVSKVICLSPDENVEGQEQEDFNIVLKPFKPTQGEHIENAVKNIIFSEINKMERKFSSLRSLMIH